MSKEDVFNPFGLSILDAHFDEFKARGLSMAEFIILFAGAFTHGTGPNSPLPDELGFDVRNGGTELFRSETDGDFAGFELVFVGTGFAVDSDGNPTAGTVTDIEIHRNGNLVASFEFFASCSITDFIAAIEAGTSDTYSPSAYADLYELFVPSFAFMIGTGSKGADTFFGSLGDDRIDAKRGNDVLFMFEGNDKLDGNAGSDMVDARYVESGVVVDLTKGKATHGDFVTKLIDIEKVIGSEFDDTIKGSKAANWLFGNDGNDTLFGKGGKDMFVFAADGSSDQVKDFQDGSDRFDLRLFDFESKAHALSAFAEVGSKNDNKVEFSFEGTTVQITGADRFDISSADLVI
jgi:Ca2+-binding RTX toxin-like protein